MNRFPTDLVTVREAPDALSAEAIALILRDANLEAFVVQPPSPGLAPIAPAMPGGVPIRVHSADLAAAQRVLAANIENSADIDWSEVATADPLDANGALPRRRRPPLLAMAGWLLATSIILLLLATTALMLLRLLTT